MCVSSLKLIEFADLFKELENIPTNFRFDQVKSITVVYGVLLII